MQPAPTQPGRSSVASWIQLILFTVFLFLLVAIPYSLYLQTVMHTSPITVLNPPPTITHSPPFVPTPPIASTTTTCITVAENFINTPATPAAYLFQNKTRQLCYPPTLPPFPFTWQQFSNQQNGYAIDIPNNWIDKSTTIKGVRQHIFISEENASTSAVPSVSFSWQTGNDPYATDSSYFKEVIQKNGTKMTIYTKGSSYIAAVSPLGTGYFILDAALVDSSFYAFQHMLDSLHFLP